MTKKAPKAPKGPQTPRDTHQMWQHAVRQQGWRGNQKPSRVKGGDK